MTSWLHVAWAQTESIALLAASPRSARIEAALPAWMTERVAFGVSWWKVLGIALAILLGLVLRAVVTWLVARWGRRVLRLRPDGPAAVLVERAAQPIGTLAMAAFFWWVVPLFDLGSWIGRVVEVALRIVAAGAGVMLAYRAVDVLSAVLQKRAEQTESKLDDVLVPLIRKSLKVVVVVLGAIFVLQNLDVDVGSLLAGASLGGLAFTLAAKETVANFFGAINILTDQPFGVGDWVVVDGKHEGIVEEVGIRSTRIRTFYNSLLTIPNAKVADAAVDNYGARRYRRTYVKLGVRYDTTPEQMEAFCEGIRAIIQANPHTRKDYYEVHFAGFGDFALEVMLYFFFEVPTWSDELRERHNVFLDIVRLAQRLGIDFAFPTQTLHVEQVAQPSPAPSRRPPSAEELKAVVLDFAPGGASVRSGGIRITDDGFYASIKRSGSEG